MAAGSSSAPYQLSREGEFSKLAQTIGTNIQKISQNGLLIITILVQHAY